MEEKRITGTMIWYYYICKRQVWLMSRSIVADQEDSNMEIGRFLHERSYPRDKKEISIGSIKIDIMKSNEGNLVIGEIKKSSRYKKSAKMQVLFYIDELSKLGMDAEGYLAFPEEKNREKIEMTDELKEELEKTVAEVEGIIDREKPAPPKKIGFCNNCAYREFCYA